jgi:hypothetical protein
MFAGSVYRKVNLELVYGLIAKKTSFSFRSFSKCSELMLFPITRFRRDVRKLNSHSGDGVFASSRFSSITAHGILLVSNITRSVEATSIYIGIEHGRSVLSTHFKFPALFIIRHPLTLDRLKYHKTVFRN